MGWTGDGLGRQPDHGAAVFYHFAGLFYKPQNLADLIL